MDGFSQHGVDKARSVSNSGYIMPCSHARLQLRYRWGHLVTGDWTGSETQSFKEETAYETNFHRTRIDVHICEFKAFNRHIFAVKIFITLKYDQYPTYTTLIVPLFSKNDYFIPYLTETSQRFPADTLGNACSAHAINFSSHRSNFHF